MDEPERALLLAGQRVEELGVLRLEPVLLNDGRGRFLAAPGPLGGPGLLGGSVVLVCALHVEGVDFYFFSDDFFNYDNDLILTALESKISEAVIMDEIKDMIMRIKILVE